MSGASGKQTSGPNHVIAATSMASTITGNAIPVLKGDNYVLVLIWTGTPTGTFAFQTSSDYTQGPTGTVINAGTWQALTTSATISASGSGDDARIIFTDLADPWFRIIYTASSGSGTLDAYLTGKSL